MLNEYYPATDEPAALTELDQKAAAVQAAIWFFSDRYVLSTTDPLSRHRGRSSTTSEPRGALVEPPPPSLTLDPGRISGPQDSAVGPFTLTTNNRVRGHRRFRNAPEATVHATGANMFSNSAGTVPIADGATCRPDRKSGCAPRARRTPLQATVDGRRPDRQRLPLRRQRRGQRRPEADPRRDGHLENHRVRPQPSSWSPARWS